MSKQLELPLSHKSDPITSYIAADKMIKSGKLNEQEQKVMCEINIHIGKDRDFTAKELARESNNQFYGSGIDYFTIQRRLSGLCSKDKIERITSKTKAGKVIYKRRDNCCVWKIKEK